MKTNGIVLALVLGAAAPMGAAPLPPNPSASHAAETNAVPFKLMSLQPAAKVKIEIRRVGKMSSRPWTEVVGWHPGMSAFPDAKTPEPQLTLASWKF